MAIASQESDERIAYVACQGWGCHEHCTLKTFVKDGKVVRTERMILKGSQAERYSLCQKGIMAGRLPYLPERILHPLKRIGERGEGKFEQISWDQAIEEISAKINEATEKHGSRSVLMNLFPCGLTNNTTGSLPYALAVRFSHTFDASVLAAPPVDMAGNQSCIADFGDMIIYFHQNTYYWRVHRPNYMLIWGGNPIGWSRAASSSRTFLEMQEKGTKIVDVGIFYDTTAAKADQFVKINPGTDAALALSMANVIISEGLYDEDFLTKHTVAPFLVREDNGQFLRRRDVQSQEEMAHAVRMAAGGSSGISQGYLTGVTEGQDSSDIVEDYVAWNITPGRPLFVPAHVTDIDGCPDLLASVTIKGIACKTSFLKLKEHVSKWTPESQEAVTGVPAAVASKVVHEYVASRPSATYIYYGMRYMNAGQSARAVDLLPILSGNLGEKNGRLMTGALGDGHNVGLDFGIVAPDFELANVKGTAANLDEVLASFEDPEKQQYKVFINCFSNPVLNWPNRQLWTEKVFPHMDLIVVNELRDTDTTAFADYVLPEAGPFEREEIGVPLGDCIVHLGAAIEPQGEAKDPAFIWSSIAKRVGIGEYFDKTNEEWLRFKLDTTQDPALTELDPPVTLDRLREEKIIRLNVPDEVDDCWEAMDFITPSGRIEFYREELSDIGVPMASYVPPRIRDPRMKKKYPLQFFPGRSRFFMQGQFTEIPELRDLAGNKSTVGMNPATAFERGIGEGDAVEVFNDRGAAQALAHLTEALPPGMALLWYAYPAKDYLTDPPTVLSSPLGTAETNDAFGTECMQMRFKAAGPIPITLINPQCASNETYWDDLCDVRKLPVA